MGNSKNFAGNSRSRQRILELMRERLIMAKIFRIGDDQDDDPYLEILLTNFTTVG